MSRAASLMRLQLIDTDIDARRARLQEIQAALGADQGLAEARAALSAAEKALAATRHTVRDLEAEAQAVDRKAAEAEARLYGGQVSNPKELQDLQEEVASLRRRRAALDDHQLEAMLQAEGEEETRLAAQTRVNATEAELQSSQGQMLAEQGRLQAELARLGDDREVALVSVPAAERQTYANLRQRKRGIAVARLVDGVCGACGVAPSSSRAQAAGHGNELIFCGNCERILYSG